MPAPPLLLGIDVGTGGSKAILIDTDGEVRANVTTEYPLSTPRPLWSEQEPDAWWRATCASISAALDAASAAPSQIMAVGLTGQMHGLVMLDDADEVLRPAILWNDQRTASQCAAMHDRVGRDRLLEITGKPALTGFTAPKVLWVREHEPAVFDRARAILLPKDYVRFRLTGIRATDVADASGTSLFDVHRRTWSTELIEAFDIPAAWLPDVTESAMVSAAVDAGGAQMCGLLEGTPVVAGAGDQAAEAVGCGVVDDGTVSVTIGTSGVVFAAMSTSLIDPDGRLHTYAHACPDRWHVMGVMLSAGGSFRWYRDTFGGEERREAARRGVDPYEVICEQASAIAPGAEGLLFLPYLTGERTPHPDPHAKGAFVGITLRHGRGHFARAVMEGVTFGLLDSIELTRKLGVTLQRVRVSGGGARSPLWRQMMADAFELEIATVNVTQGAAFGAALLAGVGAGVYASVPEASGTLVRETGVTKPTAAAAAYRPYYERYRALYPTLRSEFAALSGVVDDA